MPFLLTRPSRGATDFEFDEETDSIISTHTPLAGRDASASNIIISTHTPLAGRDRDGQVCRQDSHISTHTPLAGLDHVLYKNQNNNYNFYSHAPRGARQYKLHIQGTKADFYSHAPRGARLGVDPYADVISDFYSHAPRGARQFDAGSIDDLYDFYSHAPRGARHNPCKKVEPSNGISTHTPLAGRDYQCRQQGSDERYFYSHAPRGARPQYIVTILLITPLYSIERRKIYMQFTINSHQRIKFRANLLVKPQSPKVLHIIPPQTIIIPSGSYPFFTPKCSILFFQLFPR